jgi:hypothetical protein
MKKKDRIKCKWKKNRMRESERKDEINESENCNEWGNNLPVIFDQWGGWSNTFHGFWTYCWTDQNARQNPKSTGPSIVTPSISFFALSSLIDVTLFRLINPFLFKPFSKRNPKIHKSFSEYLFFCFGLKWSNDDNKLSKCLVFKCVECVWIM